MSIHSDRLANAAKALRAELRAAWGKRVLPAQALSFAVIAELDRAIAEHDAAPGLWGAVERMLVDAYVIGGNGGEMDMPRMRSRFDLAIAELQRPVSVEVKSDFAEWLAREMPPGTIISDPRWWAPRIEKAIAALAKPFPNAVLKIVANLTSRWSSPRLETDRWWAGYEAGCRGCARDLAAEFSSQKVTQ
jgi:hypothetical protein